MKHPMNTTELMPRVVIDGVVRSPIAIEVSDEPDEMPCPFEPDPIEPDWQAKFLQLQMKHDQLQAKLETESEYLVQIPGELETVLMDMVKESTASSITNLAYLAIILSDVFPNLGHIATYARRENKRARKPAGKKRFVLEHF